jgi:hypothetical protein
LVYEETGKSLFPIYYFYEFNLIFCNLVKIIFSLQENLNQPFIPMREHSEMIVESREEQIIYERAKLAFSLRQNLERVRNLCYMIERREKVW